MIVRATHAHTHLHALAVSTDLFEAPAILLCNANQDHERPAIIKAPAFVLSLQVFAVTLVLALIATAYGEYNGEAYYGGRVKMAADYDGGRRALSLARVCQVLAS